MISFAKYLLILASIALLLQSCVTRQQVSVGEQSTPGQTVHSTVNGYAEERGSGKLEPELAKRLGQQAHKDMRQSYPAKKGQEYANLTVALKRTNYLFYSVYSADMQGNLVSGSSDGSAPQSPEPLAEEPESTAPTPTPAPQPVSNPGGGSNSGKPVFIVNTRLGFTPWEKLDPWIDAITHIRIPGGSVSQYAWRRWEDVPQWIRDDQKKRKETTIIDDEMIKIYADFAKSKGVQTYYCLNINDKIENQMLLLDKFLAAGVDITHIELGNETYLPKFRTGDKSGLGYTHKISIEDYVALLGDWIPTLRKRYNVEVLVVCASRPMDDSFGDRIRRDWNAAIFDFQKKNPSLVDGYVVHIYGGSKAGRANEEDSLGDLDFSFMDAFNLPIHVTEGGLMDVTWSAQGIQNYKDWHRELYLALKARNDGSRYGCHVLYNPWAKANHPFPLYNPNGITPLGQAAMQFPYGNP